LNTAVFFVIQTTINQYFIIIKFKQMHAPRNLPGSAVYG